MSAVMISLPLSPHADKVRAPAIKGARRADLRGVCRPPPARRLRGFRRRSPPQREQKVPTPSDDVQGASPTLSCEDITRARPRHMQARGEPASDARQRHWNCSRKLRSNDIVIRPSAEARCNEHMLASTAVSRPRCSLPWSVDIILYKKLTIVTRYSSSRAFPASPPARAGALHARVRLPSQQTSYFLQQKQRGAAKTARAARGLPTNDDKSLRSLAGDTHQPSRTSRVQALLHALSGKR